MKYLPYSLVVAGFSLVLGSCSQPPPKVPPEAPKAAAEPPAETAVPKVGTVGLVREIKERGLTTDNWAGVVGSIFTNDTEKDVIRTQYEVTIFYKDGTQGVVMLDQNPNLRAGQAVRVTGRKIEPADRY